MPKAESIAFICPRFAEGNTVGGAETLLKNLAEHAQSAGRTVTFLTTCAKNHFTWENEIPAGSRRIRDLDVHFFPVDEDRDVNAFLRVQEVISRKGYYTTDDEMTWLRNSVNSRALCSYLKEHGSDYDRIVMGPYLFGLIYFASRIYPDKSLLVPCLHNEGFAYIRAFHEMFRTVAGVLFNSEPERDLAHRLYDLSDRKCAVVGMGLNSFDVSSSAFACRHEIQSPYIIYSGRREPEKGIPLLLDYMTAFRKRTKQNVKLVFTGTGMLEACAEIKPHIIDVGFVSEQEKHEAMAGAVAFCHPSINESFSIVLLEAWLARTPALVHAKCDVTRYHCRKSNGGLWFMAYPEFEEELIILLQDEDLRKAMGEAGRIYVLRHYSWPAIEQKLLNALDGKSTVDGS